MLVNEVVHGSTTSPRLVLHGSDLEMMKLGWQQYFWQYSVTLRKVSRGRPLDTLLAVRTALAAQSIAPARDFTSWSRILKTALDKFLTTRTCSKLTCAYIEPLSRSSIVVINCQSHLRSAIEKLIQNMSRSFILYSVLLWALVVVAVDSHRYSFHDAWDNQTAFPSVLISTVFGTATLEIPVTISTTITPSPVASQSTATTTYSATQLYAYREDSLIHLLPIQARGLFFQLGGRPTTACPTRVKNCPLGYLTGINQCELVGVPRTKRNRMAELILVVS